MSLTETTVHEETYVQQLSTIKYTSIKTSEDGVILILLGNGNTNNNKKLGQWNKILVFISSLFFFHFRA